MGKKDNLPAGVYFRNDKYVIDKWRGSLRRCYSCDTLQEAKRILKIFIEEHKEIRFKIKHGLDLAEVAPETKTFDELIDYFFSTLNLKMKEKERRTFKAHFHTDNFRNVDSLQITNENIDCMIKKLINDCNQGLFQRKLANRFIGRMGEFLDFGKEHSYLNKKIVTNLKNYLYKVVESDKTKNEEITLTAKNALFLINSFEKYSEEIRTDALSKEDILFILKFYFYLGVRLNEGRALRKKDLKIDNIGYYFYISDQMKDNSQELEPITKTGERRKVRFAKSFYDELILKLESKSDDDFVLGNKQNFVPTRNNMKIALNKILKILKSEKIIPKSFPEISMKMFRDANNDYLTNLGINETVNARNQGHTVAVKRKSYDINDINNIKLIYQE